MATKSMRSSSARRAERRAREGRLDSSVLWSGGILLAAIPLMVFYLAVIGMIGGWLDVDFEAAENTSTERVLNIVYMGMVLGTLAVSVVIGLRGWRRRGERLALAAACGSLLLATAFVVLPAVL